MAKNISSGCRLCSITDGKNISTLIINLIGFKNWKNIFEIGWPGTFLSRKFKTHTIPEVGKMR